MHDALKGRVAIITGASAGIGRATALVDHIHDDDARQAFHDRWRDRRMLQQEDVAAAVRYAVTQPDRVNVNEVLVRPTDQRT